jgi:hypothetical protein
VSENHLTLAPIITPYTPPMLFSEYINSVSIPWDFCLFFALEKDQKVETIIKAANRSNHPVEITIQYKGKPATKTIGAQEQEMRFDGRLDEGSLILIGNVPVRPMARHDLVEPTPSGDIIDVVLFYSLEDPSAGTCEAYNPTSRHDLLNVSRDVTEVFPAIRGDDLKFLRDTKGFLVVLADSDASDPRAKVYREKDLIDVRRRCEGRSWSNTKVLSWNEVFGSSDLLSGGFSKTARDRVFNGIEA